MPSIVSPSSSSHFLPTRGIFTQLIPQTVQAGAVCGLNFPWAQNAQNMSACTLASTVLGACSGYDRYVPQLADGSYYANPSEANGTANFCSCSWAAYNLLSACTACQDSISEIQNWPQYSLDCGDYQYDGFLSPSVAFPTLFTFPSWSIINPEQWPQQQFNVSQAALISSQYPDNTSLMPKKSTSVADIVLGFIGGVSTLLLIVIVVRMIIMPRYRAGSVLKSTPSGSEIGTPKTNADNAPKAGSSLMARIPPSQRPTPLLVNLSRNKVVERNYGPLNHDFFREELSTQPLWPGICHYRDISAGERLPLRERSKASQDVLSLQQAMLAYQTQGKPFVPTDFRPTRESFCSSERSRKKSLSSIIDAVGDLEISFQPRTPGRRSSKRSNMTVATGESGQVPRTSRKGFCEERSSFDFGRYISGRKF